MSQEKPGMDMVTLNIVGGILVSICRDMGVTLMRTSYSTIFSESLDFPCGLALPTGELIATGDFCPSMIGGLPLLLRSCVQEVPLSTLRPGDVLVHNDPYRGGLHTPEHTFFKPVFVVGEIMGFAEIVAQIVELDAHIIEVFDQLEVRPPSGPHRVERHITGRKQVPERPLGDRPRDDHVGRQAPVREVGAVAAHEEEADLRHRGRQRDDAVRVGRRVDLDGERVAVV